MVRKKIKKSKNKMLFLIELPAILDNEPFVVYVINEKGAFLRRATKDDLEKLEYYIPPKKKLFNIFKT